MDLVKFHVDSTYSCSLQRCVSIVDEYIVNITYPEGMKYYRVFENSERRLSKVYTKYGRFLLPFY